MSNMDYKQRLDKIKQSKNINSDQVKAIQKDILGLLDVVDTIIANKDIQADHKEIMQQQKDKLLDIHETLTTIPTLIGESINKSLETVAESNKTNLEQIIDHIDKIEPVINVKSPDIPAPTIIKQDNIFDVYKPADTDEEASSKYYGYLAKDGSWFIMTEITNGESKKYRYVSGKSGYDFSKRKGLNYDYINRVDL